MDRDPYELCPCGSGHKLKFCCADVAPEMDKLERLLANNQPRMALQGLEKLYQTHPASQWVRTLLASTLINETRPAEAKKILAGLLKLHPEQPFANVLYALAAFNADGYPECKRAIHRALKLSIFAYPDLVGTLTDALADYFESDGAVMAARQYRVLSLRLANEEQRRTLFEALVSLDSDATVPYPLRSVHNPQSLHLAGDDQKRQQLAERYSAVGCWEEAADALEPIADAPGANAALHDNIGLYRAWDGDSLRAAAAFRKSSQATADFEQAVDYEVLAQLLERSDPARGHQMRLRRFNLTAVSQLLTRLDAAERFVRLDDQSAADPTQPDRGPIARYVILDRRVDEEDFAAWTWESVPLIEGRLTIFDRDDESEQPAQAFLIGLEGRELDEAIACSMGAAGELIEPVSVEEDPQSEIQLSGHLSPEELSLRWPAYIPPSAPLDVARRTAAQHWRHVIEEIWPNTPLPALGGRTPLQCAGDPQTRLVLTAALIVLDSYADSRNYLLPLDELRNRLQMAPPAPLAASEQTNINLLTILQIQRLNLGDLSHDQFEQVMKRVTVVRQSRLLYEVLQEALKRPEISNNWEQQNRILATLAGICGAALRREEALEWISRGRAFAAAQEHSFESVLEWKMKELGLRIENPNDEHLRELLDDLWQHYGAKLPQLREYLVRLVEMAGVSAPWDSVILTPAVVGGAGESWRGEAAAATGAAKKLWLPGD